MLELPQLAFYTVSVNQEVRQCSAGPLEQARCLILQGHKSAEATVLPGDELLINSMETTLCVDLQELVACQLFDRNFPQFLVALEVS